MIKKFFLFFLLLSALVSVASAETITDNFNDGTFDTSKWYFVNGSHPANTYGFLEHHGIINMSGTITVNESNNSGIGFRSMDSLASLYEGTLEARVQLYNNGSTDLDNTLHCIGVADTVGVDGYTRDISTPPNWCGIKVCYTYGGYGGNYDLVRVYEGASGGSYEGTNLVMENTLDEDWHQVKIIVDRTATETHYEIWWDTVYYTTQVQDGACSDPTLWAFFSVYSRSPSPDGLYIDSASFDITTVSNATGSPCDSDDDCDTGNCEYGICVLQNFKEPCDSNSDCVSGSCVNGVCTKPTTWQGIDASVGQLLGYDSTTTNFLALVISLFIFFGAVAISKGSFWGAGAGAMGMFVALIFFTIVGWLSPFILVGAFFIGLLLIVLMVMIKGGAGG